MRTLNKVIEFQQEASNALFTKAQALAITMQLLELERRQPENTPEEAAVLENAMKNLNFRYLDTTETQTDQMLDSLGVARLTTAEIAQAIGPWFLIWNKDMRRFPGFFSKKP